MASKIRFCVQPSGWRVLSALIAFTYTLFWNWSSAWPVIMGDSIGYLVNAAILTGHNVDAMGSWHSGYSFVLAPLFLLDDPFFVWHAVQWVNAALVAASVYLATALLDLLEPKLDKHLRWFSIAVAVLYPSFSEMAGYGFSSPATELVVIGIAYLLACGRFRNSSQLLLLGLLTGFAYWIHPIGLCVIGAVTLALMTQYRILGASGMIAFAASITVMLGAYEFAVHEAMYDAVTPTEFERYDHYKQGASIISVFTLRGLSQLALYFSGQVAYQVIATLGLFLFSLCYAFQQKVFRPLLSIQRLNPAEENKRVLILFSLAVVILAIALGAINFLLASVWISRTDHWIYGRYSDSVLLPLLILGLVGFWDREAVPTATGSRQRLIWLAAVIGLLVVGYLLNSNVVLTLKHVSVSTLAFWPQFVWPEKDFRIWMGLGALGILPLFLLRQATKGIAAFGLLLLFVGHATVSGSYNLTVRQGFELNWRPSQFVDIVRSNWPRGSCVGFYYPFPDEKVLWNRLYRHYAFMFFNYKYRRISFEKWLSECDGPLLSFDPLVSSSHPSIQLIASDKDKGIYLVARKDRPVIIHKTTKPMRSLAPVSLATE